MYGSYSSYKPTGTIPKKASGIPRSLANSRETSPTRVNTMKRSIYSTNSPRRPERPPVNPIRPPVLAQKMLQQSREAESALADALVTTTFILLINLYIKKKNVFIFFFSHRMMLICHLIIQDCHLDAKHHVTSRMKVKHHRYVRSGASIHIEEETMLVSLNAHLFCLFLF